jgi:hypothetical protein
MKMEGESMKRLFLAVTISSFVAVGAASIYAAGDSSSARLIPGNGPITEQQIRDKLIADGFSNIQITSARDTFQTNAVRNGRALRLAIDAQTGTVVQSRDDDDDDDD